MATNVTVVICTFNGAPFVAEQVSSIVNQLNPGDELVVSDDGSTDDTLTIIEKVLARRRTPRIAVRVLRAAAPRGVAQNFHQAVLSAKTELVLLSDQDDIWYPGHRDALVAALTRTPSGASQANVRMAHTNADLIDESGAVLPHSLFAAIRVRRGELRAIRAGRASEVLRRRNIVTGATAGLTVAVAHRADPVPAGWLHDEWYALVTSYHGELTSLTSRTIGYRQHAGNQVGARRHGIRHEIGRMLYPRGERNALLLARAEVAAAHPAFAPDLPGHHDAQARLLHERARALYPASRLARLGPIWREWQTGHYRLVGHGLRDIARDLLQSAG